MRKSIFIILFLICTSFQLSWSQITKVTGQIFELKTDLSLPLAKVSFTNSEIKTIADFDGNFTLSGKTTSDSIIIEMSGYELKKLKITNGQSQNIKVELIPSVNKLEEVVIEIKENPAYAVMRNVIKHKEFNNMAQLEAYQYETYTLLEVDAGNLSDQFKKRKLTKKLGESIEIIEPLKDKDGNEFLPVFISETVSDYYYNKSPELSKEIVKAVKVEGVGITDGSTSSQVLGSSFSSIDIYENNITLLDKEFISPITDHWHAYYRYFIIDTTIIDHLKCIQLEIKPKNEQDLAFSGNLWIAIGDSSYALKKANIIIPKDANLNFIKDVKLDLTWQPTSSSAWIYKEIAFQFTFEELTKKFTNLYVRSKTSYNTIVINEPKPSKFYQGDVEVEENAQSYTKDYWENARHFEMNERELAAFNMVDTISNMPLVRSYIDIIQLIASGMKTIGPIDLGTYISSYAYNNVEQHRLRLGFRTNATFSKKIELSGYAAYGFGDNQWKYMGQIRTIISRKQWTEIGFRVYHDLDQLGISDRLQPGLFSTFMRWGTISGGYYNQEQKLFIFRQMNNSFSITAEVKHRELTPIFDFKFIEDLHTGKTSAKINTTELVLQTRIAKNEKFIQGDNKRISLGANTKPILTLCYTLGIKDVLGSHLNYHKVDIILNQKIGMGAFGKSKYWLEASKNFNELPYPLNHTHLGNQSYWYTNQGFNMMKEFEFITDQHVSLIYEHHFDGYILNRVPYIQNLNWRIVLNYSALLGTFSDENKEYTPNDITINNLNKFDGYMPYMEAGYGIENIFKILRIQVFHRLSYIDSTTPQTGIKGTLQFSL